MAETTCRSCMKPVEHISKAKNIFKDEITFGECGKTSKIYVGMELLANEKIIKSKMLPELVCEICYNKLEVCLNFRTQLVNSLNNLIKLSGDYEIMSTDDKRSLTPSNQINTNETELPDVENQINVDENKSLVDEISEDEGITRSIKEDQDNDNYHEPDSPTVDIYSISPKNRNVDNDIESDIDVCSGEDDEILELDINSTKAETIEIDNSSDSDIDVCDYEPSGKRIKNYNTLSPSVHY